MISHALQNSKLLLLFIAFFNNDVRYHHLLKFNTVVNRCIQQIKDTNPIKDQVQVQGDTLNILNRKKKLRYQLDVGNKKDQYNYW